jgi:hypothetical protein
MQPVRALCLMLLFAAVSACTTVETWEGGLPKDATTLETDEAKKAEYRRFVIRDVGVRKGKGYFEVQGGPDDEVRRYSAASFYPVIEHVSPDVKKAMDEVARYSQEDDWTDAATGAGFAAMIFGPTSWVKQLGTGAVVAGIGGKMVFDSLKKDQLEKVMERYNADLTQRIYVLRPKEPEA